jgi:hypothetical protein
MGKIPKGNGTAKGRPATAGNRLTTPVGSATARGHKASLNAENQRLRHRVVELENELERLQGKLGNAMAGWRDEERFSDRQFVATELYNGDLASLYAASTRLRTTLRMADLLAAIREIVINLIGVEAMAVFRNDSITSTLSLIDCHGDLPGHYRKISSGEGLAGNVALTGALYLHEEEAGAHAGDADAPVACLPLKVDGVVWGVIVIFRLLPQKNRLVELDYQLFDLLSVQAGVALYCSELCAERAAVSEIST